MDTTLDTTPTHREDRELRSYIRELDPANGVHIGGKRVPGGRGEFELRDPADGSVLAVVADADATNATDAVDAAHRAAAAWADRSPRDRSEILMQAFSLMRGRAHGLASLITAENGKSQADANAEVLYAAEFFRWYAEECVRAEGGYGPAPKGNVRTVVTHRPVGIAALVTPWNFPAAMATRKIGPALAAGCPVVLKPAAETPLTALAISSILTESGVPDGVVNVVPTTEPEETVGTWIRDDRVRKLSFTGSTAVGRHLLRNAASRVLNVSMELGGCAPFVVTDGADVEAAVHGAMIAKFRGGGQACTAANTFYVHQAVVDQFTSSMARPVSTLQVGRGSDPNTDIGPLINPQAVARSLELIEDALRRGARGAAQADVPSHLRGHFVAPTLLADVPHEARVVQEEIFAPIAPVVSWEDEDELLDHVNSSEMGLAAYVFTSDLRRSLRLAERLDVGMVGVHRGLVSEPSAPFGGVKLSGLGREGGREGLREYQETQYFSVDWGAEQPHSG